MEVHPALLLRNLLLPALRTDPHRLLPQNVCKPEFFHGSTQLARGNFWSELTDKCRSDSCINLFTGLDGTDGLENLGFVSNGAERTVYQTLTAGNTLVIIDIGFAVSSEVMASIPHALAHGRS